MRHNKKAYNLNIENDHQKALVRNLATSLITYEKIKTTQKKAKIVVPVIDKLIKLAKKEDKMNAIREIDKIVFGDQAGKKLIEVLAEKYKDRTSGFTRQTKLKFRSGDAATLVQIELI